MDQQITSKEKILKKVRHALTFKSKSLYQNIDLESNVFEQPEEQSLAEAFAKNFTQQNGQFVFCDNNFDCIDKLIDLLEQKKFKNMFCWEEDVQNLLKDSGISFNYNSENLEKISASITGCESLIARTGTILFSSSRNTRTLTIWAPVQIVIGKLSQLVPDIKDSLLMVRNRYGRNMPSMLSFTTGPSHTFDLPPADIGEPQYTVGANGTSELYLFLIDDTKRN